MSVQQNAKPDYQYVSFYVAELPGYFDRQAPWHAALRLSEELFGFAPADFNPEHGGRYHGRGKYGYTFEVHVKYAPGQTLSAKNHPSVYYIYE